MNIGLVLSGGMAKGAYQIGALKAISEFIPLEEIKYISCSSVGVLNGYAFATKKLVQAEKMWKTICESNSRLVIGQILKSSLLQRDIIELYDESDKLTSFFYTSLLDIGCKNIVYKNLSSVEGEKIPLFLKASVAMPIYNRAVIIDGSYFFDGAMVDNIPVFPLLKHKLDYIICIYFDNTGYKFENTYFDNKVIKITFPCVNNIRESLVFKQDDIEDMITKGFDRTNDILNSTLKNGYNDLEYIYRNIECKKNNEIKTLRITGDVLVTNLNKVVQKFADKKIIL